MTSKHRIRERLAIITATAVVGTVFLAFCALVIGALVAVVVFFLRLLGVHI